MSGTVPLAPVLDPSGETVLWSSIPPAPDAKAAAAAAATAAPASGPAAGAGGATTGAAAANGVRFAIPDLEDSSAGGSSGPPLDEEGSEGPGQRLWDPDLFNDPQLPPPIKVTVKAGEALYLPAMWWHHVSSDDLRWVGGGCMGFGCMGGQLLAFSGISGLVHVRAVDSARGTVATSGNLVQSHALISAALVSKAASTRAWAPADGAVSSMHAWTHAVCVAVHLSFRRRWSGSL